MKRIVLPSLAWCGLFAVLVACGDTPMDEETAASAEAAITLPAGNLVDNPSFESDTRGWYGWHGSITRTSRSDAPNGAYVARVSSSGGTMYSSGRSGALVTSIPAGATYRASAYVRSGSSSAFGKPIQLVLRERNASGAITKLWTSPPATLGSTFQLLQTNATAPTAGNALELYVVQDKATSGDAFYLDAVSAVFASSSICVPTTCAAQGKNCGNVSDGCGGTLACGVCTSPQTCGGAGIANVCGSTSTGTDAGTGTGTGTPQPVGAGGTWKLVFDDEFDGTSLDTSKWRPNWLAGNDTTITKPVNSAELSCFDPKQVSVSSGSLRLTAVARSCTASNGVTYNYASGMVQTYPHFNFTYGFMEARMWIDGSAGAAANWPSFWADGTPLNWPASGEIDVMEGLSGDLCWHYHYSGGGPGHCPNVASAGGWHTFGANWQPGRIDFYYDGVKDSVSQTTGVVNNQMFLIIQNALSDHYTVTVPSTVLVDYVRVWQ